MGLEERIDFMVRIMRDHLKTCSMKPLSYNEILLAVFDQYPFRLSIHLGQFSKSVQKRLVIQKDIYQFKGLKPSLFVYDPMDTDQRKLEENTIQRLLDWSMVNYMSYDLNLQELPEITGPYVLNVHRINATLLGLKIHFPEGRAISYKKYSSSQWGIALKKKPVFGIYVEGQFI